MRRILCGFLILSLIVAMLAVFSQLEVANAWSGNVTITINADGTVDPAIAPIQRKGNQYILTDDIYSEFNVNAIVIERNGITLNGKGHTLQGQQTGYADSAIGIYLNNTEHVTIKSMQIKGYFYGVFFETSSKNTIIYNQIVSNNEAIFFSGLGENYFNNIVHNKISNNRLGVNNVDYNSYVSYCTIAYNSFKGNIIAILLSGFHNEVKSNTIKHNVIINNEDGVVLQIDPQNNVIAENNIAENSANGIELLDCEENTIKHNTIKSNGGAGIKLGAASNNKILKNNLFNNAKGIEVDSGQDTPYPNPSSNNRIVGNCIGWDSQYDLQFQQSPNNYVYNNNLLGNPVKVENVDSANTWDNGYPSGGNYWSSYTNVDNYRGPNQDQPGRDGIWDAPLMIDPENTDNYPLTRIIKK